MAAAKGSVLENDSSEFVIGPKSLSILLTLAAARTELP
jgi:hypothetical protein